MTNKCKWDAQFRTSSCPWAADRVGCDHSGCPGLGDEGPQFHNGQSEALRTVSTTNSYHFFRNT